MLLRRVMQKFRAQDWFAVCVELFVLVLGIVLGLQAADWSDARRERAEERRYLQRLLADNESNRTALQQDMDRDRLAAAEIQSITEALADGTRAPEQAALEHALCRWFVQPDLHLQRATYAELVSSGKLLLIRDQRLRAQLASEEAAHAESQRLDVLIPAVQRGAEPIDPYRTWYIDTARATPGASCRFDVAGMRRDPRVASALAQLYRNASTYVMFRQRQIDAVEATRTLLVAASGREDG